MGCLCGSQGRGTVEERQINDSINRQMRKNYKNDSTTHRILLLGPGDSGKTTILKQMRKIYLGKISEDTIESYKSYIRQKIINYMKILCIQSIKLNIAISPSSEESREYMNNLSTPCNINADIVHHMKLLWNDDGIQKTLSLREKYQIPDNVEYFFDQRLDDIIEANYVPTFDDYIRIRMRTTGFTEEKFTATFTSEGLATSYKQQQQQQHVQMQHNKSNNSLLSMSASATSTNGLTQIPSPESNNTRNSLQYKDLDVEMKKEPKKKASGGQPHHFIFTDVGGQRSERKKWLGMMQDDIDAVVYIFAISEYDLMCFEDSKTLRLTEALNLFEKVLKAGFMDDKTVTIFFNKYDLLIQKLNDMTKSTIKDHFDDFPDDKDARNPDHVCEYVLGKFYEIYQRIKPNASRLPHNHRTSALDTNQIDKLMGDIQTEQINAGLSEAGW